MGEFLEKGFNFISIGNDLHHIQTVPPRPPPTPPHTLRPSTTPHPTTTHPPTCKRAAQDAQPIMLTAAQLPPNDYPTLPPYAASGEPHHDSVQHLQGLEEARDDAGVILKIAEKRLTASRTPEI